MKQKIDTKRSILRVLIIIALGILPAAQLVNAETLDGPGKGGSVGVEEIAVEGVGANEREAVEDAFRNAIEKSIGLYVDNETKMQNDQLISDNILTSSKGYVDKYRIVSKKEEGGLTKVEIKALVKMDDVKSKLTGLNISIIAAEDSANIHARLSTKLTRSKDAEEILIKELADFFQAKNLLKLLQVKLKEYKIYENEIAQDKTVSFEVAFEISINIDNYNQMVNELSKVFINIGGDVRDRLKVEIPDEIAKINYEQFDRYNAIIQKEWNGEVKDLCFGLISYKNNSYILDHYCFPVEWKTIYPWDSQRNKEIERIYNNCGRTMILQDLEVILQFTNNGTVIFEKKPEFKRYSGLRADFLEILKLSWPDSGSQSRFGARWGSAYEKWHFASGFNIGPFMQYHNFMTPGLSFTFKDRIPVDLLYDIQNVEVKLGMKEQ